MSGTNRNINTTTSNSFDNMGLGQSKSIAIQLGEKIEENIIY